MAFFFTAKYKLTSVKVVPLDALKTNKYAHPIWHLISDSNSVPVKSIIYGVPIRGMKPDVKGARPAALEPNVPYRLLVEAGSLKGEHDFQTTEKAQFEPLKELRHDAGEGPRHELRRANSNVSHRRNDRP